MNSVEGITDVIISDREGLIITSQSRGDAGDELVLGAIAATIDTYIERIKGEFSEETSFFNTTTIGDKKFAYCSKGLKSILLTIANITTPDNELRVYSEHIARKVEFLLEGNEDVSLEIPAILGVLAKTKDGKIPTGDFPIKLILIGDYNVGKTSLILRFVENSFKDSYHSTIGVEISQKSLDLSEGTKISFVIWDIGGQITQMAPYRKRFYSGANSAFLVIDRTRSNLSASVERWYNEIKKYVSSTLQIILIGNKSDLTDEIVVSEEEIKLIADKFGFNYILTSAKTGENVVDSFLYIAYKYLESA
ncbi:MAG: GTP-binding protein [Promethearchaeota archaeon]|jgi:small GTP-binding protein